MKTILLCFVMACLVADRTSMRPFKPGVAKAQSAAPSSGAQFTSELKQPENAARSATQNFERTTETELPLPPGTKVQEMAITRTERKFETPYAREGKTVVFLGEKLRSEDIADHGACCRL